jgi:ABC-type uncharacterized transport system ATPase subunit
VNDIVVEMRGITKRFPGIIANDQISFAVKKGEIHALLGENGAGKSTLMNILFGLYEPDEGEIRINGQKVAITDPNVANRLGIGMVHQHFMLVENFTVTENIILGQEPRTLGMLDINEARKKVVELSNLYGLAIQPDDKIEKISVGMQQRVEILKTLYRGADILIFDEPTAVLTPQEIEDLIGIMHNLVREGKSIILITHKLKEIMKTADTCTIIRRGKVVGSVGVAQTSPDELASLMVGHAINFDIEKSDIEAGKPILRLEKVTATDVRGSKLLDDISLEVRSGEIVGIAGVDGNGQSELIEAITGLRKIQKGHIFVEDEKITNLSPRKVMQAGISHIPEDRHKRGLILDFTIGENMVLETYHQEPFSKNGWMNMEKIYEHARKLIKEFDIRTPDEYTSARALSGGNQQKAIIAREVDRDPKLLIAAQPTRGLDVGAIEFIHKRLVEQRAKKRAVLLVSLELEEIMKLSDRIAVMYNGRIVGIVDPKTVTDKEIGLLMAGGKQKQEAGINHDPT